MVRLDITCQPLWQPLYTSNTSKKPNARLFIRHLLLRWLIRRLCPKYFQENIDEISTFREILHLPGDRGNRFLCSAISVNGLEVFNSSREQLNEFSFPRKHKCVLYVEILVKKNDYVQVFQKLERAVFRIDKFTFSYVIEAF